MINNKKNLVIFLIIAFVLLGAVVIYYGLFYPRSEKIVIAEIKDDLSDNYLNYIDKPSWLVNQALRLIIPPLIDYDQNCWPVSKLLKEIPSSDNKMMFLESKRTVLILSNENFVVTNIKPVDIISTVQLLNLDNISDRWVFRNLVESIDRIDKTDRGINIYYKMAYSLPYFPSPVIFDNPETYKDQILNFTFREEKNFSVFPHYSEYKVKKSEKNHFVIVNKPKSQEITFLTYTNPDKLEISKTTIIKIPSNLKNYFEKKIPQDYEIITLPHKEMYLIFFNPNLSKEKRILFYKKIKEVLSQYRIENYILNDTYILPYHFAGKSINTSLLNGFAQKQKNFSINNFKDLKILLTYKDKKSKLFSNLIEEVITKNFGSKVLNINVEEQSPRKEIFGILIEPPELSLKETINPYEFDIIITSITFLPYMNYYLVYSKDGKYNVYSVSTPQIEEILDNIMEGFSYKQKDYLIELQDKLFEQFLILPLAIDTQTFIVKKEALKKIKITPNGLEINI